MKIKLVVFLGITFFTLSSYTLSSPSKSETVFYQGSYDDFLREAKKLKRPILLDFWATWCGPCKKMDQETYTNSNLAAYINSNFMIYKVDIDSFDGMAIADRFMVESYPTLIMLDYKAKFIARYKGFFPADYLKVELQKSKNSEGKRMTPIRNTMATL